MARYEYYDPETGEVVPEQAALSGGFNIVDEPSSMLGGSNAEISSYQEPSFLDRARQLITDNLFGAPDTEVSWDNLDQAKNPDQQQAPGYGEMFSSGIDQLRSYPATAAAGLMSATNIPGVRDVGSDLLKYSKPTREQDTEVFSRIPEDSISSYVAPTALGIGKMVPFMLSGLGPLGLASGFGLSSIGEKEAQMEDRGLSREEAAPAAAVSGVANALLSSPLFATARSGLSPLAKSALGGIEGAGQGFLGSMADIIGTAQSTGEAPSFEDAMRQSAKQGLISAGVGAAIAPLGGRAKTTEDAPFELPTENIPPGTRQEMLGLPEPEVQPPAQLALPQPEQQLAPPAPKVVTEVPSIAKPIAKEISAKEFPDVQAVVKASAIQPQKPMVSEPIVGGNQSETLTPSQVTSVAETFLPSSNENARTDLSGATDTRNFSPSYKYTPSTSAMSVLSDSAFISKYHSTISEKNYLDGLLSSVANEGKFESGVKTPISAATKIIRKVSSNKPGYTENDLGDIIRGRIETNSPAEAENVLGKLRAQAKLKGEPINYNQRPNIWGFRGISVNVETPKGNLAEIQIHDPESIAVKEAIRPLYEQYRNSDPPLSVFRQSRKIAIETAQKIRQKFSSERGSITTEPFRAAVEKAGSFGQGLKNFIRGSDPEVEGVTPTQARYEGGRLRFLSRDAGRALGAYRKNVEYLSTAAKTDPRAGQALEAGRQYFRKRSNILFDARDTMDPYFSASKEAKANLDKDLIRFRQASLNAAKQGIRLQKITPEFLASKGWSPEKIEMWKSVREGMDQSLEIQREAFYREADNLPPEQQREFITEVDNYIEAQKDMNYIPLKRFGENVYLEGKDASGKVVHRSHYDSVKEAKKELANLKAKGLKATIREIPTTDFDADSGIPPQMLPEAGSFNAEKWQQMKKEGKPLTGFSQHLVRAGGVEGFNPDITQNISDYLFSLANFAAHKDLRPKVKQILQSIDPQTDPALSGRINAHFKALTDSGRSIVDRGVGGAIRISNFMNLAATPITAIADIMQAQALAVPQAIKEMKGQYNPLKHVEGLYLHEKALAKTIDYMGNPFKKKGITSLDRATLGHLKAAERDGLLGSQTLDDLYDYAAGPGKTKPLDQRLMFFKTIGEKAQRTSSFLTGLELAKKLKLKDEAAYNFAREFFYKVVPDTTKADNPLIMNNPAIKVGTLYKKYLGFDLRLLRNWASKEDFPLILTSMAMRTGIGGALAIPFAKEGERIAKSFGVDVRDWLQKLTPEKVDELTYGLTSSFLNLSPSISTQEFLPDIAKDPHKAIMSTVGGPLLSNAMRMPKAYSQAKEGKYWNAFETAAPRFMRNASKATRLLTTGKLEDAGGNDPGVPPTLANAGRLLLGAPPIEQTRFYDMKNRMYDEMQRGQEMTARFNRQFTEAFDNKDFAKANSIAMEAAKNGVSVKYKAKADPMDSMIKRAPKVSKSKMMEIRGIYER